MITNASILRIDRRAGASAKGKPLITTGSAHAAGVVPCFVDEVSNAQRNNLGQTAADASQVCYVSPATLGDAGEAAPSPGDLVTLAADDGGASVTQQILLAKRRTHSDLSHFELYLKAL